MDCPLLIALREIASMGDVTPSGEPNPSRALYRTLHLGPIRIAERALANIPEDCGKCRECTRLNDLDNLEKK